MTTFKEIEQELIRLKQERKEEEIRHEAFLSKNSAYTKEAERIKAILLKGLDAGKIKAAEKILNIHGLANEYDADVVQSAIEDIACGGKALHKEYFGTKDYEHYHHQRCDCTYGLGPRHGSIVFSIGLKQPGTPLSGEQIEICLYYLNAITEDGFRQAIAGKRKENPWR